MKRILLVIILFISSYSSYAQLNTDHFFYIAKSRIYFGNYVSAIENFNIVIKLKPFLPEPYFYRGMAKLYIDDFRGAKADFDKAIEIKPYYPEAYMYRGMSNYEMKNFREAMNDYSNALEYNQEDPNIFNNRGITRIATEDFEGAIADYTRSIEIKPSASTYLNRSSAKQMKGDLEGAIKDCDAAIRLRPHFSSAYLVRGIAKFEKKDYAGALKDYDLCIRLDPKTSQAYVNRGIVKHQLSDLKGAIRDYDMAITLDPNIATAWLNRGIAKESLKLPGSEKDLATAAELDPKFATFKKRLEAEEERERQRRQYGFYLPNPGQNSNQAQNNQATGAVNQAGQGSQTGGNSLAATTNPPGGSNQGSTAAANANQSATASNNLPSAPQDSAAYKQENKSGPVTQNRKRRNIVVADDGKVSETDIVDGMVQNKNVKIVMQPDFVISVFNKDSIDYSRLQYYSMEIEMLNNKNNNDPFLIVSNKPFAYQSIQKESFKSLVENWSSEISANKKNSNGYLNRGIILEQSLDYNASISDFTKAIDADNRNILAYFCRANSRAKMVDAIRTEGALPEPEILNMSGSKTTIETRSNEIKILDYEDIIEDYESLLYMNPNFIFAWFNMANTKVKKRDYLHAINDYNKAIALEPDFGEAYFNRGLTRIYMNDLEGGALDLSRAGELGLTEAYNVIKRFCN
jgi:tetratricopeptide (TPR) repeat protein